MEGYVYVLINPAFPDLVKIGRTTKDPKIRAAELSATGTPDKFVVAHQILVKDCVLLEQELHESFSDQRHSNNREFFNVTVHEVISAIERFNIELDGDARYKNVLLYAYKINGSRFFDAQDTAMPTGDFRLGYVDLDKLGFDIHTDDSEERNMRHLMASTFKNLISEYYEKFGIICSPRSMCLIRHDEFKVRTEFLEKLPIFLAKRMLEDEFFKNEGFKIIYDGQTIMCPIEYSTVEMADMFSSDIFFKFCDEEQMIMDLDYQAELQKIKNESVKKISLYKGVL